MAQTVSVPPYRGFSPEAIGVTGEEAAVVVALIVVVSGGVDVSSGLQAVNSNKKDTIEKNIIHTILLFFISHLTVIFSTGNIPGIYPVFCFSHPLIMLS
jgi:uncharacterized membrane protein